ncbi:GTP-binding protein BRASSINAZOLE INSENSITIVE PALE GREEN 2, chloroplastic [Magnolia sinica]|uniref:GTP-binding protein BRASSINAZOLE INSENSITIVE PALE GREEN 2, chloroplastic n=1 Tax=Magnolia sinica TaxID=86752 RepID=UPI002659C667|nr:GTP-binding protein BRASSINAZOLE INSENSITIVE PALE GREEN 2, chloroplastic [Magnolia sinica]XP_058088820.1 GTP-binding protein BRASSINAZOLE INSENSITIVE PALE GREEN 2, chloroplastic [Magnolia sinica]
MAIFSPNPSNLYLLNNSGCRNPTSFPQSLHPFSGNSVSFSSLLTSFHRIHFNQKPMKLTPKIKKTLPISCSNEKPAPIQSTRRKPKQNLMFSEGRDEDEKRLICPGCGVFMQDKDPNLPGFYQKRVSQKENEEISIGSVSESDGFHEFDEFDEEDGYELKMGLTQDGISSSLSDLDSGEEEDEDFSNGNDVGSARNGEIDWDSDWEIEDDEEKWEKELDGFAPPGIGYGNITEETLKKQAKKKISKTEKKQKAREARREEEAVTVCARCHSLRNYGQVKNERVENLIPDFDFDRLIATRLLKPSGNSSVVVMVVDCVDFDGSFPKRATKSLFKALEGSKKDSRFNKLPKLVLVATKVDLLPSQVSPTRLDRWVRNRAKAGGAPKLSGVYLVSARKDLGIRNLLAFIKELAGPRGNVWVIGAQNAGKSTLINAFAKREGVKISKLTEAAVPGTTLGILRIGGILPAKAKMYDTPGLLHPYLMTMRLNRDEQKMVEIRKELQPRTYRIKAGQAVHIGALLRLDLIQASVATIYVTVWVSPNVSLHLGKIENADEIWEKHAGIRLQPPIGADRLPELGEWKQREFKVSGISWEVNCIDIAVAGLGWFSLGLKGEATLALWIYDGIETTPREPLVLDRAPFLERAGFLLPKAISDAIGHQSRLEAEMKKLEDERSDSLSEASI